MSPRVFSGIQPTGDVHVGNYLGAIKNWVKLQGAYESIFCIVDYHAVTVEYDPKLLHKRILDLAATTIAAGVDPSNALLFVQSSVPEHTELTWLLTCITSIGALERMTQFKDKSQRQEKGSIYAGLMSYPILQTADIILYKADLVPVGDDQLQHLELAREITRRFNGTFGELFPEPKPLLTEAARIMALNDPSSKMSKSLEGSYISLNEEPDSIRKKIKRAVTDEGPEVGVMGPGVKNLFTLLEGFAEESVVQSFKEDYAGGKLRYKDLKETIAESMIEELTPIQELREELLGDTRRLEETLMDGGDRARKMARETIKEAREIMGFLLPGR